MVTCFPPVLWLWDQHSQLHRVGTDSCLGRWNGVGWTRADTRPAVVYGTPTLGREGLQWASAGLRDARVLGLGRDPDLLLAPVKFVLPGASTPAPLPAHSRRAALPVQTLPQLRECGGRGRRPFSATAPTLTQPQVDLGWDLSTPPGPSL